MVLPPNEKELLDTKEGQKHIENVEEKITIKVEPSDYLDPSSNEYLSEPPLIENRNSLRSPERTYDENEDKIADGSYFVDPQNMTVKVESQYQEESSSGYESMLIQQEHEAISRIIASEADLNHRSVTAVIKQDPLDDRIFLEEPLHSELSDGCSTQPANLSVANNVIEDSLDLVNILRNIKIEKKAFNCDHCNFASDHRAVLKRHMKYHMKCEELKCPECGNYFTTVYKMREHFRTHSGEKPYKCTICSFSTSYPSSFKYHMRSHMGEKPYACSLCPFRSVSCTMLTRHMRVHTGEKPFKCHMCDYRARAKGTLKSHLRIHTGEKPFTCNYCDKSFVTSSAVRKHLFIHMKAKEHKCILCNVNFPSRTEWQEHLLTHGSGNQCEYCGTKAGSRFRLKTHMEKSREGGPFKCKYCAEDYKYKCAFMKHIEMHEEYKPFKCDKCDYKGPSTASLRFHKRTKHSLVPPKKFECADCNMTYDSKSKLIKHLCVRSQ